MYNSLLKACGS